VSIYFPLLRLIYAANITIEKVCQGEVLNCKHLFSRDEMKYHEEDRMAEKGLDLPAGRQGGTFNRVDSKVENL
jgi:hypothetical protein